MRWFNDDFKSRFDEKIHLETQEVYLNSTNSPKQIPMLMIVISTDQRLFHRVRFLHPYQVLVKW